MDNIPTEYEEQCVFVEWLELKGLKFTAIPNSTWTSSWQQKVKNKKSGLRAGLPDMLVLVPDGIAWVELKRKKKSVLKDNQKEWIEELNKREGSEAKVCYGSSEAIEFIKQFT
jgi:hypothetical protein